MRTIKENGAGVRSSPRRKVRSVEGVDQQRGGKVNGSGPNPQLDSAGVARNWIKRGVAPVPIAPRGKKPVGGKGWNTLRVKEEDVDQFFYRGYNVGGLWGLPSDWVVDIDLDTAESAKAASKIFPETFIYGRNSAPGSHYLFRSEGAETRKFQIPEIGMLVELRSTGSQSVLPPSIHPSGEHYKIYHDVDFTPINRARLLLYCRMVAAAAVFAKYWPEEGSRHDYIVAVSGALLWSNWQQDPISKVLDGMLAAVDSEGEALEKHKRTVRNVIKNYKAKSHVPGWPSLSQWMPGEVIKKLRDWLKLEVLITGVPEEVVDDDPNPLRKPLPPRLLSVPGLVGEIARWQARQSFLKQPLFDLATGLAAVAFCSRNLYLVDAWDTPLQPYFLLSAPTAAGKGSSQDSLFEIAYRAGLGQNVFQGFQSYHAMLDRLSEEPSLGLLLWDECARKLRSASRSQAGMDYQMITYFLQLYGKGAKIVAGTPGRKQNIQTLKHPFFLIFAAAQPTQLLEVLSDADLQLGLVNRFILLDAGDKVPAVNENRDDTFPSALEKKIKEFTSIARPQNARKPFIPIRFENTAVYRRLADFVDVCRAEAARGGNSEIWGRTAQNAIICAGIVAIGLSAKRPIISKEIADWAVEFLTYSTQSWGGRVEQTGARTINERSSKYVEMVIRRARDYFTRARSEHERHSTSRGIMPKPMLYRLARHMRGRELDETIGALVEADLIAVGEVDGRECYWPKGGSDSGPTTDAATP
jgi:hypothetical protein